MRLIDANALMKKELIPPCGVVSVDDIKKAPTIDPESLRPKGRWVNEDFLEKAATVNDPAICSNCKKPAHKAEHGYAILSKFCPNCGADMRGESK